MPSDAAYIYFQGKHWEKVERHTPDYSVGIFGEAGWFLSDTPGPYVEDTEMIFFTDEGKFYAYDDDGGDWSKYIGSDPAIRKMLRKS